MSKPQAKVLVLRTCSSDLKSHSDFTWPKKGPVKCNDFKPTKECGNGLHGFLWGEGDGSLANWDVDAKWLVVEVLAKDIIELDQKVKFRKGKVVFTGGRLEATKYLADRAPNTVKAIIGHSAVSGAHGTSTSGDSGTSTSGDFGTSTSGCFGTSTSGDCGTSTSGAHGTSTSGYSGTSTSGDYGTSTSGCFGTSTSGDRGTSTSGDFGTSTSGCFGTSTSGDRGTSTSGAHGTSTSGCFGTSTSGRFGTSTSGDGGTIICKWWDAKASRYKLTTGYVGEDGIEANVKYKADENGKLVRA